MSPVTEVRMKGWQLDAASLTAVTKSIVADPSVTTLTLSDVGLSAAQVHQLADGLVGSALTTLTLEWNTSPVPAEQGGDISECYACLVDVKRALNITSLTLRGNKISDKGATKIASTLANNHMITFLNLYNNNIGDAGAIDFAVSLRVNSALKTLSLSNNRLTGKSVRAFGKSLTRYSLSVEEMAERRKAERELAEAKAAAEEAAKKAKKSKKKGGPEPPPIPPDLPPVEVNDDGTAVGFGNKTLSTLNLSANDLDDEGVTAMHADFTEFIGEVGQTLENLFLNRNKVSPEVGEMFNAEGFEKMNVVL